MYFLSCEVKTGKILGELPLKIDGTLQRALMTVTDGSFTLSLTDRRCPKDWDALTLPTRVVIVVCNDSDQIVWAGIPTQRTIKGASTLVQISATSLEGYLDRRFVPHKRFDHVDQSDIAAWLVQSTVDAGIPIEIDAPASGILRDRSYFADDSATVLKRLQELSEVIEGPEWWIETTWAENGAVKHVFHVGYPRIGLAQKNPHAVFEMPGGLQEITLEERWGTTDAATFVVVYGEGEGEDKPRSREHVAIEKEWAGYPRLEMRSTASSVTEQATLETKAEKALARFSAGTRVLTLTQLASQAPFLGKDWRMGDDVRVICNTASLKIDEVMRLVGWEIPADELTVKPIVASMTEEKNDEASAL